MTPKKNGQQIRASFQIATIVGGAFAEGMLATLELIRSGASTADLTEVLAHCERLKQQASACQPCSVPAAASTTPVTSPQSPPSLPSRRKRRKRLSKPKVKVDRAFELYCEVLRSGGSGETAQSLEKQARQKVNQFVSEWRKKNRRSAEPRRLQQDRKHTCDAVRRRIEYTAEKEALKLYKAAKRRGLRGDDARKAVWADEFWKDPVFRRFEGVSRLLP